MPNKKIFIPIIIVVLAAFGYYLYQNKEELVRYEATNMPLSFTYNPETYRVSETATSVMLMLWEDYEWLMSEDSAYHDGPAAIVFTRYDNPNNPGPMDWATQYPQLSNYGLKTSAVSSTTVAGFPAIQYEADGLYANRNVVFADDVRIYHLYGPYLDQNTPLYRDFYPIVESMTRE
jgi:hypothetical protein